MANATLIPLIDALLPQTQCGQCGHPGCAPYAQAIANGEAVHHCVPGGQRTIDALARLLDMNVAVLDLDTSRGDAPAQVAFIREAECIGCTKCIQACPVDAIVGAAKLMHTVIIDECTGCDLCVAPCPVDCIEMHPLVSVLPIVGGLAFTDEDRQARSTKRDRARRRFEQRNARLQREEEQKLTERLARAKRSAPMEPVLVDPAQAATDAAVKKAKINLAMSRAQLHKSLKAFGHPPTSDQQSQLIILQQHFETAERALATLETDNTAPPAPKTDADLKRAKIQLAMRRAEVSKLQRQPDAAPNELAEAQRKLEEAQRLVDTHA